MALAISMKNSYKTDPVFALVATARLAELLWLLGLQLLLIL
jgi:hypothetical protein